MKTLHLIVFTLGIALAGSLPELMAGTMIEPAPQGKRGIDHSLAVAADDLPWGATFGFGGDINEAALGSFELAFPLWYDGNDLLFLYPEFTTNDRGQQSYSLGLGFRTLLERHGIILGGNIFYDLTESEGGHHYSRLGLGAEVLTKRFDARFNAYLSGNDRELVNEASAVSRASSSRVVGQSTSISPLTVSGAAVSQSAVTRTRIATTDTTTTRSFEQFSQSLDGWDTEAGVLLPFVDKFADVRAFGGYVHYDNPFGDDLNSFRGRLEARLPYGLILDALYYSDKEITGSHWYVGGRLNIPLGRKHAPVHIARTGYGKGGSGKDSVAATGKAYAPVVPSAAVGFAPGEGGSDPLRARLAENVIRDPRARTAVSDFMENADRRRVEEKTRYETRTSVRTVEADMDVIFVDAENAEPGDGSLEDPFQNINLAQDEAQTRFGEGGRDQLVYVFSDNYDESVTFDGSGLPGLTVSLFDSSQPLNFNGLNFGGDPKANWTAPSGETVLSVFNTESFSLGGFSITGNNIPVGGAFRALNVNELNVTDTMFFGNDSGAFSLNNVGQIQVQNATVNTTGGDVGVSIFNSGSGVPGNINFANFLVQNPNILGMRLQDNQGQLNFTQTGGSFQIQGAPSGIGLAGSGQYTFDNLEVANSANNGVLGSNFTGTFNVTGPSTINGANTGIDIDGETGSFTFSDTDISNTVAENLKINGGNSSVSFGPGSQLTQANNGTAVRVQGGHTGNVQFLNGSSINATNGDGLQFDNADGVYDFQGPVMLNGGDAGIDILGGSAGTFTFANTDITDPAGGAGIDINGGSATVNFEAGSSITQGQNFAAINVTNGHTGQLNFNGSVTATNGDGLQFDNADGTYDFQGPATLNGGDAGIDILGGSAGTFTFGGSTSITGPTGNAVKIDTGAPNVTYEGTITKNNGQKALDISNTTGGTIQFVNGSILANNIEGSTITNAASTIIVENARLLGQVGPGLDLNGLTGSFTLRDSTIDDADAGGIVITGGNGTINIERSTLSNNMTSGSGGGIFDNTAGTINVTNATISGNMAGSNGGGISIDN